MNLGVDSNGNAQFLQKGFYLVNDGGAAYAITVESFEIGSERANSRTIARIPEGGKGFALVWLDGCGPLINNVGTWDLLGAMRKAYDDRYPHMFFAPDYVIKVSVVYRDADNVWYRSSAPMTYIRSQNRINFGPTVQVLCGSKPAAALSATGTVDEPTIFRPERGKGSHKVSSGYRRRKTNPAIQQLKAKVRQLRAEGLSHEEICKRLGSDPRPPHAAWRHYPWPVARVKHPRAVTKWLSEACTNLRSVTT